MSTTRPVFVYKSDPVRGEVWAKLFAEQAPQYDFRTWPDTGDPAAVRYLYAWIPPPDLMQFFPNLRVLFSAGAGVDQFDFDALPAGLPVVRMIERGIEEAMVEYATCAVLSLHRNLPQYLRQQAQAEWHPIRLVRASRRRIGVLGMGVLGQSVLARLASFGFDCAGWSRSRHAVAGVQSFAGHDELPAFLRRTEILICLLPLTDATRGILNAEIFAMLPAGAQLVHVGRGPHLVDADLRAALDSGHLSQAILDVCDPEPPPAGHWLWRHPRVWLTPHIASMTQPETAVEVTLANLRRFENGEAMLGLVDRDIGY